MREGKVFITIGYHIFHTLLTSADAHLYLLYYCSVLILSNVMSKCSKQIIDFYVSLHKCVFNPCGQVWNNPEAECGNRGSVLGLDWKGPILHVLWSHSGNLSTATGLLYQTQCTFIALENEMYKDVIRDSKRHRIRQDNRIDKESVGWFQRIKNNGWAVLTGQSRSNCLENHIRVQLIYHKMTEPRKEISVTPSMKATSIMRYVGINSVL